MRLLSKLLVLLVLVPALMAATIPSGYLTTSGDANISGISVQSGAAVFPGDTITTGIGGARLNLSSGKTIQMQPNSVLRLSKDSVLEIVKGMSRMQSNSGPLTLLASNWNLQGKPDLKSGILTADVVRTTEGKVSLNVSSGSVVASRGQVVMVAALGQPALLPPDAPPAGSAPANPGSSAAAPPRKGGFSDHKLALVALAVGGAGIVVGAVGFKHPDREDQTNTLATLQASLTTTTAQITALTSQNANLLTNLNALSSAVGANQTLNAQLNIQIQNIVTAQAALAGAQATINGLVAKLAANGSLSAADQSALATAQAIVTAQSAILATSSAAANSLINQIKNITIPSNFKP